MARALQPVSIEDVEFDALVDSTETLSADAPTYPVETGFEVSDTFTHFLHVCVLLCI